jgi:hypothetical protein
MFSEWLYGKFQCRYITELDKGGANEHAFFVETVRVNGRFIDCWVV